MGRVSGLRQASPAQHTLNAKEKVHHVREDKQWRQWF